MPSSRLPSSAPHASPRNAVASVESTVASSGIQPALDWHMVVSAMLDRLNQPALLVDPRGIVRLANHAFATLAGCSAEELQSCEWSELFEDDRATALASARRGERRLELRTGPRVRRRLALRAQVTCVSSGSSEAHIVQVEGYEPLEPAAARPLQRRRYTVSASHHTRGTLLEVEEPGETSPQAAEGACYRTLANRSQPCTGCPVFGDLSTLPTRVVLISEEAPGGYQVVEVDRKGDDALAVETMTLREEVLSELIAAKIEWIARQSDLTPREREILTLLYLGRSTQEVAMLLDISERTAKYHQANVLRKVGADSRVDLVRLLM